MTTVSVTTPAVPATPMLPGAAPAAAPAAPANAASSNARPGRDKAMKAYAAMGELEAKGQIQRSEFFVRFAADVHDGSCSSKDAKDAFAAFTKKKAKVFGDVVTINEMDNKKPADAVTRTRTSELTQIALAAESLGASVTSFADLLQESRPWIIDEKSKGSHRLNTQDAFVVIARAQILKSRDNGAKPLSEGEVRGALVPKGGNSAAKDELAMLKPVIRKLESMIKGCEADEDKGIAAREPFDRREYHAALSVFNRIASELEGEKK